MKGPKYNSQNQTRITYVCPRGVLVFLVDGDRRNSDRMVVGFMTTYVISASKPVHTEMYSK
jgi:hypothetical protein